jgi:hypothetical protein
MDAIEIIDSARSADDISAACLATHTHLKMGLPIIFKLRDVLPFEVLSLCAMPHACIGHD